MLRVNTRNLKSELPKHTVPNTQLLKHESIKSKRSIYTLQLNKETLTSRKYFLRLNPEIVHGSWKRLFSAFLYTSIQYGSSFVFKINTGIELGNARPQTEVFSVLRRVILVIYSVEMLRQEKGQIWRGKYRTDNREVNFCD